MLRENDAGILGQASTGYRLEETVGDGGAGYRTAGRLAVLALGSGAGKNWPLGGWLDGWTSESLVLLLKTTSTYE